MPPLLNGPFFVKKKKSITVFESIKAFEIKTSTLFNLDFANNVLSCFFLFFLIIDLYSLLSAFTKQAFNPIAELVIPIGIPTKEAKTEMETYPLTAEIKMSKCSI